MINHVLAPNGSCLTLQNGMGNVDILQRVLGESRVLQGSTSQAAMIRKPGSVEHTGIGYIKIATPSEAVKQAASWWVKTLMSVGLAATPAGGDFERVLWEKLIINSAINPLTSLYGVKNGELRNSESMKRLMKEVSVGLGVDCRLSRKAFPLQKRLGWIYLSMICTKRLFSCARKLRTITVPCTRTF